MRKLLLTALAVIAANHCIADDEPALKICMGSGDCDVALPALASIKYTETDMIVNMKDGSQQVFPLDDIIVMKFGQLQTAIDNVLADKTPNTAYSISDIEGKTIAVGSVRDGISLPNEKGIYILTIGEKTKKILIK